jgi:hypothetical protein
VASCKGPRNRRPWVKAPRSGGSPWHERCTTRSAKPHIAESGYCSRFPGVCSRHFASLAPATTLRVHHPPISRTGKSAEATPEVVVCF